MDRSTIVTLPQIRLSAADMTLLRDDNGLYVLLRNEGRFKKGHVIYTPVGGGIMLDGPDAAPFLASLGFAYEKNKEGELVGTLPGSSVEALRAWFLTGAGLEANGAKREFQEEVGDEEQLLSSEDIARIAFVDAPAFYDEVLQTTKAGFEGVWTLRLVRVFTAHAPAEVLDKLRDTDQVRFCGAEEIRALKTDRGEEIAQITLSVLSPAPTILPFVA